MQRDRLDLIEVIAAADADAVVGWILGCTFEAFAQDDMRATAVIASEPVHCHVDETPRTRWWARGVSSCVELRATC
jgi:hypothetical protein